MTLLLVFSGDLSLLPNVSVDLMVNAIEGVQRLLFFSIWTFFFLCYIQAPII